MIKEKIFVKLTDDILFKEALAHKDNRDFLEYFLETILNLDEGTLHNKLIVSYESIFENKKYGEKNMRGDIVIEFDEYTINVEAYSELDRESISKSTHYIMKIYSTRNRGKEKYHNGKKSWQINIVDEVDNALLPSKLCSKFVVSEVDNKFQLIGRDFEIYYLRIDLAQNNNYNKDEEKIARMLKYIGARSSEERDKIGKGDRLMEKMSAWLEEFTNDQKYKREMGKWAEEIEKNKIRRRALKEGIEQNSLEIAKRMLAKNKPIEEIIEFTGLSKETINSFNELNKLMQ